MADPVTAEGASFLQVGDYSCMLVFETMYARPAPFPMTMSDTFQITDRIPATVNDQWRKDLGAMLWNQIEGSGLVAVVRHPNAPKFGFNDKPLQQELTAFMRGILLQGIPYSDGQHVLSGQVQADGPTIQNHSELIKFRLNLDLMPRPKVTEATVREAYALSRNIMGHLLGWNRIGRAFHYLMDAFSSHYSEDRLHMLVRAMDGLVKTGKNQGRVEFAKRCTSTFLKPHPDNYIAMEDLYYVRNAIEHVHNYEDEPWRIPDKVERAKLRERRLRQLEVMALHVYKRLVGDAALLTEFATDKGIDDFWALPDDVRFKRWNDPFDLDAVK